MDRFIGVLRGAHILIDDMEVGEWLLVTVLNNYGSLVTLMKQNKFK